jgi:hypothetical protein
MTGMILQPQALPLADILARFRVAQTMKQPWEQIWQDCGDYTLPYRQSTYGGLQKNAKLFDGTAGDNVDQLASSLLAQLTPPWSSWIGMVPGPQADEKEAAYLTPVLQEANEILQGHFDRSNFAVEMHQAFLDLVTYGTACLRFDETEPGALSAFQFHTTPLNSIYFLDSARGQLESSFCLLQFSSEEILARFPQACECLQEQNDVEKRHTILYAVTPQQHGGYILSFILYPDDNDAVLLEQMVTQTSPFTAFRWQKSAGELYGRSPIMKALPDIKTANKVVELILKNASIAVTGIWLADDDGILNPANIQLVPGAIIPKAVGSAGLTPLKMPGNFDISQLVLSDLRQKISHALLGDYLFSTNDKNMTATEVLQRQSALNQMLGATFGRLQGELLTPLAMRALAILKSRGEIADLPVDGRKIALEYRSPLARTQGQRDAQATMTLLQTAQQYGDETAKFLDIPATLQFLAKSLGVPSHLIQIPASFTE